MPKLVLLQINKLSINSLMNFVSYVTSLGVERNVFGCDYLSVVVVCSNVTHVASLRSYSEFCVTSFFF